MATLVDTNVLIDIAVRDPVWSRWSRSKMTAALKQGSLIINQIIYAEFSMRYETIDDVDSVLPEDEFRREGLPFEAAFAASRAFSIYRRMGGPREKVMPDFLIGAHAVIRGYPILTRDPTGFRTYFPDVELIAPDTDP
ncbi:type II toxin-antitoxin system VapC family toxin [Mesorhizobium sp. B2-3-4]|uniref:type II toxin-antitoxin system VapC family toxin n=1 Tax=Mesorhizobium sp. B2-3-4 TaxID=2589959 RepID=UPI00112B3087|nr:type II toxin-antitoxin system VapC family toxin [Mesorhizobium sp. B2-3-4]TPM29371.1 type II toxin-antitoxin system VapC family toxin [Mesorhizobium sp. B2-3-4]